MLDSIAIALTQFHFLRPYWFLLLAPVLVLCVFLWRQQRSATMWQSVVAPHLLPFLLDGQSTQFSRKPLIALGVLWSLFTIALAGPTWSKMPQPVHQKTSALVIAWDMSPSMMAQDLKPSRLVRSRLKLIELLRNRKEGLTALIAYSGEAHVVTPLTDDTATIESLLNGLSPAMMPSQGSQPESALELANQLLHDSSIPDGDILFVTDGIADSALAPLQQIHATTKHKVSVWGFGTPEGAPIPLANGGFAYDQNRTMVIAGLDQATLSDVATNLGGIYIPFSQTEFDLKTINSFVLNPLENNTREVDSRVFDQWFEYGPYLVLVLLPFAALAFRRGWLLSLPLVLTIALGAAAPQPAQAFGWQDLWQTKDQQAQKKLDQNPAAAAQQFNNQDWKAIANYRAGNYEQALKQFDGETAQKLYNQGNALTQLGKYDDAIDTYKKALEQNEDFESAWNNLAIAKKLKELQQQKNQQQQNGEGDQSKQNKQDDGNGEQSDQDNPSNEQSQQQNQNQNQSSNHSSNNQNQQQNDQANSQQNSQQQDQKSNSQSNGASNQEQTTPTEPQTSEMSDEQKQALDQTYKNQKPDSSEQQEKQQQNAKSQQNGKNNEQQERESQQLAQAQQEKAESGDEKAGEPQQDADQPANSSVIRHGESQQQSEAQQSLEQWLRKVPDNPSRLLQNKFNYEHQLRKRERRQSNWRLPEEQRSEQRW